MNDYNPEPYKSIFDSKFFVPQGSLSAPTSINTANQIAEVNARLNAGVYGVDLSTITPEVANMVPKQHFEEIRRLTKLTGANASVHGPIVDLAGFSQQGYDEGIRKSSEYQMNSMIEKAYELTPKEKGEREGNVTVNFHVNTQVPGEYMRKLSDEELGARKGEIEALKKQVAVANEDAKKSLQEDLERLKKGELMEAMGIVNQETGETSLIKYEAKETPQGMHVYTPSERLKSYNLTNWDQSRLKIFDWQKQKDEINQREKYIKKEIDYLEKGAKENVLSNEQMEKYQRELNTIKLMDAHKKEIDTNAISSLNDLYNRAKKYLPEDIKFSYHDENKRVIELEKGEHFQNFKKNMENLYVEAVKKGYSEDEYRDKQLKLYTSFISSLPAPELWTPTNKIALEKTAETVANSALTAYNKFGEHSPIITLENYQPDLTLGSSEKIKETIEESRRQFAEKLMQEKKGISNKEAMQVAEKLIGVTWDVGHINFLRRKGFGEEDILKQAKTIAPYVKQLHITDNFGFTDSHLPPGMGNVPMKEHIEIMKKAGFNVEGKEGRGRLIVETGEFVQQFKENPHLYTLESFSSPLYTLKAEPRWYSIRDTPGAYGIGLGNIYPEQHFNMYGSGFATLPRELGGQVGGEKSRFAGTPNA